MRRLPRGVAALVRATIAIAPALALVAITSADVGATFPGTNGQIAFASNHDGDYEIYLINADGSGLTQLTNNTGVDDRQPAWSADGRRIAWESTQGGSDNDIWVMDADGSNQIPLTVNGVEDTGPKWSPDGSKIVYASTIDGPDLDVFVMNDDGTGTVQLTFNTIFDCCPAFSPDGLTIAYQPQPSGSYDIWKMNADGTGQTPLAATPGYEVGPNWAPDGSKIIYSEDLGNGSGWGEIFTMNPDGTGRTNLTNTATIWDSDGNLSPDGSTIAFISNQVDAAFDLYIMNADGTGRTVLYANTGSQTDADWGPEPGPITDLGDPIGNDALRVSDHGLRFGGDQDRPDVGGKHIVWRDFRGDSTGTGEGQSDDFHGRIWSKDINTRAESPVSTELATDDPNPRVSSGAWSVWTDHTPDSDGDGPLTSNDDIYACKLPCTTPFQVTTHGAHQMNPAIDGNTVVWEDYRNVGTTGVDLFKKNLPGGAETVVTAAPEDQVSPSINGNVIAWRDNPGGAAPDEADVYVKVGNNPPLLVANTDGNARSLSEFQVAVTVSQVLWNEKDPACTVVPQENDPEDPDDDFIPCNLPRLLKTASFSSSSVTSGPFVVDSVLPLDSHGIIADLDMSGNRGVWSKAADVATHTYTRAPIASGAVVPVDDTEAPLGGFATGVRVDGSQFTWMQQASSGPVFVDGFGDIFWRSLSSQPRRANSISLGRFGGHFSPVADGDLVVYARGPNEVGGTAEVEDEDQLWATDLSEAGARRHFRVSGGDLGTSFARPAIVGDRVVWRACQSQGGEGACGPISQTEVADLQPGAVQDLSNTGGPDADGSLTGWRCGDTEICVRNENTGAMRTYDVADHFLAESTASTDDFGVLSDNVRVSDDESGDLVVWHELSFDPAETCEDEDGCQADSRIHVLDVSSDPVDAVIASGELGASDQFDISGATVVWANDEVLWHAADWSAISVADWSATDCDGADTCPEELVSQADFFLSAPTIDGDRVAWIAEDFGNCCQRDIYTLEIGVDTAFHFVKSGAQPYVDGDRIYFVADPGSDVYVISVDGGDAVYGSVDVTPPAAATLSAAVAFGQAVELSWTNPASDDFFRVRVIRTNGTTPAGLDAASGGGDAGAAVGAVASVVYEGAGTAFTDTDVVPGTKYTYSIFAFDYEPNYAPAATVTVTA